MLEKIFDRVYAKKKSKGTQYSPAAPAIEDQDEEEEPVINYH